MEAQSQKQMASSTSCSNQQLKQLIINTYRGRSMQQIREAESVLIRLLQQVGFLQRLITIMFEQKEADQNFRKAIANLIKKYSYTYAQNTCDKSQFIQTIFQLILSSELHYKVKQLLGIALQHQFNADQDGIYKKIVHEKALLMLCGDQSVQYFDSLIIISTAYMNSLVEVEDQIQDFTASVEPICIASLKLLQYINNTPLEQWLIQDKILLPKVVKLFEFLQTILQRLLDQETYYQNQIDNLRKNQFLITVLEQYLLLFHNNHSIISQIYPAINTTKNIMLNIICMLYKHNICPIKMFHIIFLTFLSEARNVVNDITVENILVSCIKILTSHLQKKIYLSVFIDHKMQVIFSLFMYSVTTQQQYELIEAQPQKFVELAQQYTQRTENSTYLKVRAAIMIQTFTQKVDEVPKNILEIIMMIMTGSLQPQQHQTQIMVSIKAEFSKFNFFGLLPQQKLQTSFMILSVISPYINHRPDMNKVVYAFFLTQFQLLVKITSPIVILRLMRVVSYFPCALYFLYIETQMSRGKIFIIQGIKSLQRILRTNRFAQLFSFLATIFSKLLGVIQITDPVMQLIVINNYDKMLKHSPDLYRLCRNKIKEEFLFNVDKNQHATTLCFNLLYALIKKQTNQSVLAINQSVFYQISEILATNPQAYNRYEQKLLQIYILIINKNPFLSVQIERFAQRSLKFLARLQKGTLFFKFYNIYILKLDGAVFKLQPYFRSFKEELNRRYTLFIQANQPIDSIAYFCFLMSQIIANNCQITLASNDLQNLLTIASKVSEQNKQYPLIVFLTYLYIQPYPTVNFLKNNNVYQQFLYEIVKIKFQGKIIIKIFTLSLVKLLQIQQDPIFFKQILTICITFLKNQFKQSSSKTKTTIDKDNNSHPRRLLEQKIDIQQSIQAQQTNDNELINLFVNYKHPFSNYSEYDQFKVTFWQNDHLTQELNEEQKKDLRIILETEWINNKTRAIRRVKKI